MGFKIQKTPCATCIYKASSPLDIKELESQVANSFGGFDGYRICHHGTTACCHGFWKRHKNQFQLGQIAQRLGLVELVVDDNTKSEG